VGPRLRPAVGPNPRRGLYDAESAQLFKRLAVTGSQSRPLRPPGSARPIRPEAVCRGRGEQRPAHPQPRLGGLVPGTGESNHPARPQASDARNQGQLDDSRTAESKQVGAVRLTALLQELDPARADTYADWLRRATSRRRTRTDRRRADAAGREGTARGHAPRPAASPIPHLAWLPRGRDLRARRRLHRAGAYAAWREWRLTPAVKLVVDNLQSGPDTGKPPSPRRSRQSTSP